jgi:hypothetical protein
MNAASTELWRLGNGRREQARAVVLPGGPPHTLALFVDNVMDRAENFDTLDLALFRADDIKRAMLADGWRDAQ